MRIADIYQVNQDISNLEVLLKFDTNDGLALNVHKYQSVPTNPAAAERCRLIKITRAQEFIILSKQCAKETGQKRTHFH